MAGCLLDIGHARWGFLMGEACDCIGHRVGAAPGAGHGTGPSIFHGTQRTQHWTLSCFLTDMHQVQVVARFMTCAWHGAELLAAPDMSCLPASWVTEVMAPSGSDSEPPRLLESRPVLSLPTYYAPL